MRCKYNEYLSDKMHEWDKAFRQRDLASIL